MTRIRALLVLAALLGALTACGSDDDSDTAGDATADAGATDPTDDAGDDPASPPPETGADGAGTGTLTMADGTVYELEMSTCDTSENSEGFVVPDSYDLFGRTSDSAFTASFNRAGFDEDTVSEIVTLEGDFDENGRNAGILYRNVVDTIALTVDGGAVAGTVTLKVIGPAGPHGDQMDATVDISC